MTTTSNRHPKREECLRMLRDYGTPEHVVGHCKAVAAVGYTMAKALNSKGFHMDLDLVLAAGLLHDMARVEDNHWDVAADFCESKGLHQEAEIIRVHMSYDPFNDLEHLNETDVICMADRIVLEDRYAGIVRRMDYIVRKAERNGHPEYKPIILRKRDEAKQLLTAIEEFLGCTMDDLCADIDYECVERQ